MSNFSSSVLQQAAEALAKAPNDSWGMSIGYWPKGITLAITNRIQTPGKIVGVELPLTLDQVDLLIIRLQTARSLAAAKTN